MSDEKKPGGKESVKKPNIIARSGGAIARYLREMRSELKKVVWPSRKQLVNNSTIVVISVIAVGIVIAGYDVVCNTILSKLIEILRG